MLIIKNELEQVLQLFFDGQLDNYPELTTEFLACENLLAKYGLAGYMDSSDVENIFYNCLHQDEVDALTLNFTSDPELATKSLDLLQKTYYHNLENISFEAFLTQSYEKAFNKVVNLLESEVVKI